MLIKRCEYSLNWTSVSSLFITPKFVPFKTTNSVLEFYNFVNKIWLIFTRLCLKSHSDAFSLATLWNVLALTFLPAKTNIFCPLQSFSGFAALSVFVFEVNLGKNSNSFRWIWHKCFIYFSKKRSQGLSSDLNGFVICIDLHLIKI